MTDASPNPSPTPDPNADPAAVQPEPKPENVGRGALFAAGTVPIAVAAFWVVGWLGMGLYGVVLAGLVLPAIAAWLYKAGSGGQLTRRGWGAFIGIAVVAILAGVITGVASTVARQFGGGNQLWNALWINLRDFSFGGQAFWAMLGLLLGVVGIVLALRQKTPAQRIAQTTAQWTGAPGTPPAAPQQGPILNGEPLDPDRK